MEEIQGKDLAEANVMVEAKLQVDLNESLLRSVLFWMKKNQGKCVMRKGLETLNSFTCQ
jgi:hypothetical protein